MICIFIHRTWLTHVRRNNLSYHSCIAHFGVYPRVPTHNFHSVSHPIDCKVLLKQGMLLKFSTNKDFECVSFGIIQNIVYYRYRPVYIYYVYTIQNTEYTSHQRVIQKLNLLFVFESFIVAVVESYGKGTAPFKNRWIVSVRNLFYFLEGECAS